MRNLFRSEYRKRRREVEDVDGSYAETLTSLPEQNSRLELGEFRKALKGYLASEADWRDARNRFGTAFYAHSYSIDRIVGAAILSSEGGERVQILGALIHSDAPYTVLKGAVFIHPTLTEGFFTLLDTVTPVN